VVAVNVVVPLAVLASTSRPGLPVGVLTVDADESATVDPAALWRPSHTAGIQLHPGIAAAWAAAGASRSGDTFTFRRRTVDVDEVLAAVDPASVDAAAHFGRSRAARLAAAAAQLGAPTALEAAMRCHPRSPARVQLDVTATTLRLTFTCAPVELAGHRITTRRRVALTHAEATAVVDAARRDRWPVADRGTPARFGAAASLFAATVAFTGADGAPGLAEVNVGGSVLADLAQLEDPDVAGVVERVVECTRTRRVVVADAAAHALALDGWVPLHVDADVDDLAAAADHSGADLQGLTDYQSMFVHSYLAVPAGVVCALPAGSGKTVCAAAAFARRARRNTRWAGLVVAPTAVLEQWRAELATWCAGVTVADAVASAARTAAFAAVARRGGPVLVLTTPAAVAADPEPFAAAGFDDVCVDEASWLRSPSSKRSAAMWSVRAAAGRALALSATPSSTGVDDLGALVAWVCGDRHLFDRVPLSSWGAGWSSAGAEGVTLADVCGATVFTADVDAAELTIPPLRLEITPVAPSAADVGASEAMWSVLRAAATAVRDAEHRLEGAAAHSAAARRARAELASARAGARAALRLARTFAASAAVPAASGVTGAERVAQHVGLGPSTKQAWAIERVTGHVRDGGQALVFADADAALADTAALLAASGVRVGTLNGRTRSAARTRVVGGFAAGELDAVMVGPAAQQGVNLPAASLVVHLDTSVSGTVAPLVQRCARAARIGSQADAVTVAVPVLTSTVDDAVSSRVLERFAAAVADGTTFEPSADAPLTLDELLVAGP
jgi:hypothetical protein